MTTRVTMTVTNLDDLLRMRERAQVHGFGSRQWIDFARAMFDAFPYLYNTAQRMNAEMNELRSKLREATESTAPTA